MSRKDFNKAKKLTDNIREAMRAKKLAESRILKRGYIRCEQRVKRYLYPSPKIKISKKKLTEITNALEKVVKNGQKCSKDLKFIELSKSNDSKIMNNFDKNVFKPFWNKYRRYFNHLFLEMPGVSSSEIQGRIFIDDNDMAEWFNLQYVTSENLISWYSFIYQWRRFLAIYKRGPRAPITKKIYQGINKIIISIRKGNAEKTINEMLPTINSRISRYITNMERRYPAVARTFSNYSVSNDVVRRVMSKYERSCKEAK